MACSELFESEKTPHLRLMLGGSKTVPGPDCANLGHKQDDESWLPVSTSFASLSGAGIYVRARYYEPTSGRFLSEDPDRQAGNWFSYCENAPVAFGDASGKDIINMLVGLGFALTSLILVMASFGVATAAVTPAQLRLAYVLGCMAVILNIGASCSVQIPGCYGGQYGGGAVHLEFLA